MENELIVNVYKFMGTDMLSGRTSDDGSPSAESLRKHVLDNWDRYERISILLDNVVQMTRPFMDEALPNCWKTTPWMSLIKKYICPTPRKTSLRI